MIKLIGILIIIIGFIIKFDTIAVVLIAGLVTGLVSGMSLTEIISIIGTEFVKNRYMTLFFLTLPVIGILENYGLKERAGTLISRFKSASAGRILSAYQLMREIAVSTGISGLGGHVQFVRPLIHPMAAAAAEKNGKLTEEEAEQLKGNAAAAENFGNFFAQNVFPASGGVLLMLGALNASGYPVKETDLALASIPVAVIAFIVAVIKFTLMDKKFKKGVAVNESK